jgi:hypothetical protein
MDLSCGHTTRQGVRRAPLERTTSTRLYCLQHALGASEETRSELCWEPVTAPRWEMYTLYRLVYTLKAPAEGSSFLSLRTVVRA